MKRFTVAALLSLTLVTGVPAAYAGFEWMPPAQNPAPTMNAYDAPAAPTADSYYNDGGVSAPPVVAEPLNNDYGMPSSSTVSSMPSQSFSAASSPQPRPVPQMQTKNLSGQGLVINPYPLRDAANSVGGSSYINEQSVNQAMAEQSRVLNPLHLGGGLKTGAQPRPAIPSPMRPSNNDIANMYSNDAMTPMLGGEPAPLPGSAVAPVQRYAEAVGFGKDLPLALALSQVIPSEYSPSFADGVDAGISVSWEGGKPWDQTLNDMLAPEGLAATVNGQQVVIHPLSRL